MRLAIFEDKDSFDLWHQSIKQRLGIPHVNFRASDDKPCPQKCHTTQYAQSIPNKTSEKILTVIDEQEDITDLTSITIQEAKRLGWFVDEED